MVAVEGDAVVATFGSECNEVLSVEVNAVEVDVVGVFFSNFSVETGGNLAHVLAVHAISREDDEAFSLLVNLGMLHTTHPIVTFGHLGQLAVLPIIYIKVCMSVAVALPEDVFSIEVLTQIARVCHIFFILLFDEGLDVAFEVHLQHPIGFVTTLVELERERLAVLIPLWCCHLILRGEKFTRFRIDGLLVLHIHHHRNAVVERVAWLGILLL